MDVRTNEDAVVPNTAVSGSSEATSSGSSISSDASATYERKRRQLLECLSTAERNLKGSILEQQQQQHMPIRTPIATHTTHSSQRQRSSSQSRPLDPDDDDAALTAIRERRFRGEESIFKKPPPGIMKCLKPRRTPDYQANPHRWKKYSLSDADTSDRTNTAAAFEFLKQIESQKHDRQSTADETNADHNACKIVFNQRGRRGATNSATYNQSAHLRGQVEATGGGDTDESQTKPVLRGSKVLMPEYVIGQKVSGKKPRKTTQPIGTSMSIGQPKLGHLFDADEDDED